MPRAWQAVVVSFATLALSACAATPKLPPTAAPTPLAPPAWIRPSDSWIEIDLAAQTLTLHEGSVILATYPVSTGVMTDPKYATPPDLYRVQSMDPGPIENVPGVFISDIIMFDLGRGNGIHSLPMDAAGTVVDSTVGVPATAGCVRVSESRRVFEFAEIGMWVWIH